MSFTIILTSNKWIGKLWVLNDGQKMDEEKMDEEVKYLEASNNSAMQKPYFLD